MTELKWQWQRCHFHFPIKQPFFVYVLLSADKRSHQMSNSSNNFNQIMF